MAARLTNHPLSAPNASVRLLNGPKTGPSTSTISAQLSPSLPGSTWLARQAERSTGRTKKAARGDDQAGGWSGPGACRLTQPTQAWSRDNRRI